MINYIWPKITKDTTIEKAKKIHQKIWNYVIEHGTKSKTPYYADCATCEYCEIYKHSCQACPIIWPKNHRGERTCSGRGGLFIEWFNATGDEKIELASQIRDLPWKFETEENS